MMRRLPDDRQNAMLRFTHPGYSDISLGRHAVLLWSSSGLVTKQVYPELFALQARWRRRLVSNGL